jgi:hypothetical protein
LESKSRPDMVRFVSIQSKAGRCTAAILFSLPDGEWFVRVIASKERFVFRVYRHHTRHMPLEQKFDHDHDNPEGDASLLPVSTSLITSLRTIMSTNLTRISTSEQEAFCTKVAVVQGFSSGRWSTARQFLGCLVTDRRSHLGSLLRSRLHVLTGSTWPR